MNNGVLSSRLKEARKKVGLTQQELADKIGVAKSVIAGAETKRGISKGLAIKLAKFFETDITYWTNENADEEFIQIAKPFETTKQVVLSLLEQGILDEKALITDNNGRESEIMKVIISALKFDIRVLIEKSKKR